MKTLISISLKIPAIILTWLIIIAPLYAEQMPVRLLVKIALPGVSGRIDHMAIDRNNHRLFIAALGNNSLEIVDLQKRKRIRTVPGLREPQGIVFMPGDNRLIISNGGDGSVLVFDTGSLRVIKRINLFQDADNLRYDIFEQRLYAAYGRGAIGIFDAGYKQIGNIHLPGHPESFALSENDGRIFVNIPAIQSIAVLDTGRQQLTDSWRLPNARGNFPMALDQASRLLLVGTRFPAQLVGLNTQSGKIRFKIPVDGDADDIFIDNRRHRIYVSCGAGYLDVLERNDSGAYQVIKQIPTATGARTSLFVPEMHRLFLAVPRHGRQQAAIWIFAT